MLEIFIIFLLILLNGVFSMSEMALVSSRKFKLEAARKKGTTGSKTALELSENPTRFFSTVQIGITLIGILLGIYSGDKLTSDVEIWLKKYELLAPYAHNIAVVVILVIVTFVSILFGELFPKKLGILFPEQITLFLAKPMSILSKIASPFVWMLTISNNLVQKALGIKENDDNKVSEEEIKSLIKESAETGEIQDIEQDIVERVFELGDRKAGSLMTHRGEVVFLDTVMTLDEIHEIVAQSKHSAYPLVENGKLDEVIGIVQLKDLFVSEKYEFNLRELVKTPIFITENTFAYNILKDFQKERIHYGIVLDEYGSVVGIVTMDDVMDALVGDTSQDDQQEYQIIKRADGSWIVDGQLPFIEFSKTFDLNIDEDFQDKFNTIAGYLIYHESTIPKVGEIFIKENLQYEILDKDGQRIDKILVTKI